MRIVKRYTHAVGSSNLKCDAYHFDTDILAAVAMSSAFGSALFRLKYFNEASIFPLLLELWRWEVKKHAAMSGWPERVNEEHVADESLKFWMNDLCPFCGGKGVKKMEFVDILSNDSCDVCKGSGKKSADCSRSIKKFVMEMVSVLEERAITASNQAMQKLSSDMDL